MPDNDDFNAALALRRAMLGDAYVDAQAADPNPTMGEFSDHITSMAWGVWARGGVLSTRDRSLLVLAMTAALGRMEEFRLHASEDRTGVTDDELDELLLPDCGLLRRPGRERGQAGAPGRAGRAARS